MCKINTRKVRNRAKRIERNEAGIRAALVRQGAPPGLGMMVESSCRVIVEQKALGRPN